MLYNLAMAKEIKLSYSDLRSLTGDGNGEIGICVAVSGGRDSVALLHCLKGIECESAEENPRIVVSAVNVEHGIRGEASVRDSEFVSRLCKEWNIPLFSFSVNVPKFAKENGYTEEQAGRILRYDIFDKLIADGKCDFVALAHHLDDQVETVFMRILRGTGIRGLSGMKKVSGRYLRPLLGYGRDSIDRYIEENGLEYVDDATNGDTAYTRNYLREVLSDLKSRYPHIGESVGRLCDNAREADEYIESQLPEIEVKDGVSYIKTVDCANKLIAKRLIYRASCALGVMQDIEDRHYSLVLDLIEKPTGKYLMLTHGLCVYKEGDRLAFTLGNENLEICEREFQEGDFEDIGLSVKRVDKSDIAFGGASLYIDGDKLPRDAVIRGRRTGDVIRKFGGGTKSLGDFLTDKKIPLRKRDGLAVIAKDSTVYAVPSVDISADVGIDENTETVYELKIINRKFSE